jgi:hypothetical protein
VLFPVDVSLPRLNIESVSTLHHLFAGGRKMGQVINFALDIDFGLKIKDGV